MALITEDILAGLGIEVVGESSHQIKAHCPVHHLVKGRPDSKPSWYMNSETGAWICFSCQQRGSLAHLLDLLDLDSEETLGNLPVAMVQAQLERVAERIEAATVERPEPTAYISDYAFGKNPIPPKSIRELRGLTREACELYNLRWSKEDRCFLIPVYSFAGELLGWQEKSKGYFNNVPKGLEKSRSLFGYQQLVTQAILVESPLDAVRLASLDIPGGVSSYGAWVSNDQLEALAAAVDSVIVAMDNDDAGETSRDYVGPKLRKLGVKVKYFIYPGDKRWSKREGMKDIGDLPDRNVIDGVAAAASILRQAVRV